MNATAAEELAPKNQQQPADRKLASLINRRRSSASSSTSGDFSAAESQDGASSETSEGQNEEQVGAGACSRAPEYRKLEMQHQQRASDGPSSLSQANHAQQQHKQDNDNSKGFEEVKQVELFGVRIVALTINGKERLCLAQISNTLLKEFSYNEIHNRRVALGITCIQCTPIQLEMLRRAGAMPSSSRRCGMITMREAERLCRSFLVEEQTPELPDNFYFTVAHRVNYGCKGRFIPARYISSRAKCIECFYCGEFYSPNKFIFHSHRQPHVSDCNPPDSPNINSWRKHIDLDWTLEHNQEIKYAWEDVKSLFNGGTRRRAPPSSSSGNNSSTGGPAPASSRANFREPRQAPGAVEHQAMEEQLIDVECDGPTLENASTSLGSTFNEAHDFKLLLGSSGKQQRPQAPNWSGKSDRYCGRATNSLMLNPTANDTLSKSTSNSLTANTTHMKRFAASSSSQLSQSGNKRFAANCNLLQNSPHPTNAPAQHNINKRSLAYHQASSPLPITPVAPQPLGASSNHSFSDFLNLAPRQQQPASVADPAAGRKAPNFAYPLANSSNFIYSQLYNQLMQSQQVNQQQQQQQQASLNVNAQLALRHHLWSSLLANLQCNTGAQTGYGLAQTGELGHCNNPIAGESVDMVHPANLNHLISAQLYSAQPKLQAPSTTATLDIYKAPQGSPYALHKYSSSEANDL